MQVAQFVLDASNNGRISDYRFKLLNLVVTAKVFNPFILGP